MWVHLGTPQSLEAELLLLLLVTGGFPEWRCFWAARTRIRSGHRKAAALSVRRQTAPGPALTAQSEAVARRESVCHVRRATGSRVTQRSRPSGLNTLGSDRDKTRESPELTFAL